MTAKKKKSIHSYIIIRQLSEGGGGLQETTCNWTTITRSRVRVAFFICFVHATARRIYVSRSNHEPQDNFCFLFFFFLFLSSLFGIEIPCPPVELPINNNGTQVLDN